MSRYVILDTNILLLDSNNLFEFGDAIVVLPETVLAELDSKKSGFDEINFQARACGRLLASAVVDNIETDEDCVFTRLVIGNTNILVVSIADYYDADADTSSKNDQRILYVANELKGRGLDVEVVSNDVMMRLRAIAVGIDATDMKAVDDVEFEFVKEFVVDDSEVFRTLHNASILDVDSDYKLENYNYKFTCATTEQVKLATISRGFINVLGKDTERELRRQDCAPINSEQLMASKAIQDTTVDIVMIEGQAGSGKNIVAVSNAIKLMRTNKDKYSSIVYIRSPQNDESMGEDIGYLSTNEAKMDVYLGAMDDTLDFIVRSRIKKGSNEKVQEYEDRVARELSKLIADYGVTSTISTGLRGRTFHDSIVIIDEAQNTSPATMVKILTRVGKNCKVIVIGSQKQIDNKYISKYTNGLAVLMNEASIRNIDTDVNMYAITLDKVVRSDMAEFAEALFSK